MSFDKFINRRLEEKRRRQQLSNRVKSDFRRKCVDILKRYHIQQAVIFGSVVDRRASEQSDIDLLVQSLPSGEYWNLHFDLEQAMEIPIDLYTQDDNPGFVRKILERGEVIYEV